MAIRNLLVFILLSASSLPCFAAWGDDLAGGVDQPLYSPSVRASCEFEGDLIVGGRFDLAGGVAVNHVARWDGDAWSPLGSGLVGQGYASTVVLKLAAGSHTVVWDGRNDHGEALPSGSYVARMTTVTGAQSRKLVLAK